MQVFNHTYESESSLNSFIENNLQSKSSGLLIQVFTGIFDKPTLQRVLNLLRLKLPNASIIGASTSGEILNGKIKDNSISISFSLFEKTQIKLYYSAKVDFDSGKNIAQKIVEPNIKAIISLSESLKSDPQDFFKGFETVKNDIIIAGGNAGDNEAFKETFVIKDSTIYDVGVVMCALISKDLLVHNNYTLNWTPIGSELTITKAKNNVVYEINNKPILEVCKYYFGDEIEKNLPNSINDFPLLKKENGVEVARSLIRLQEDKSFLFAGHFSVGDKVRFSIANIDEVFYNANEFSKKVSKNPSEGIFIYSCSVRRNFLKDQLNEEFRLLEKIAPTSGFFTYGEFFNTGKSTTILNISTTILSLSEVKKENGLNKNDSVHDFKQNSLKSLTHLINITQTELEDLNENLENIVEYKTKDINEKNRELKSLLSSYDKNIPYTSTDLEGVITDVSEAFCKVSGYTREELIGVNHSIVRHPDTPPSKYKEIWKKLLEEKPFETEIQNLKKDGGSYWVKSFFTPEYDKNDKHIGYRAVRDNISDRMEVESLQKEIADTQKEVVFKMGSIAETRSKETGLHVKRVAEYSKLFATKYGLSEVDAELLQEASPMHDIGKVAIPDDILNKPGKLTDNEMKIMKTHAQIGFEMLHGSSRPLLNTATIVAHEHHEKWDGTGYPQGLRGLEINIYGRITAIADVFDALGSERIYKKAWSNEEIFTFFKEQKGKHFEPKLVDIFFDNVEAFLEIRDRLKDIYL